MKKILFLGLILCSSMVLTACGGDDAGSGGGASSSSSDVAETSEVAESSAPEEITGGIGETLEADGIKYTLNSIEVVEDRNEYADTQPTNVIKVQYTMENTGDTDVSVGMDLKVYDANDTQGSTYALENTMGALDPGKKIEVTEHVGIEALGEIELQFAPVVSFANEKAVFKVAI